MFVPIDNSPHLLISREGKLRTPRLAKVRPETDTDGHPYFQLAGEKRYVAIEVLRHHGRIQLKPGVLGIKDIQFLDGNPSNCDITNLSLRTKALEKEVGPEHLNKIEGLDTQAPLETETTEEQEAAALYTAQPLYYIVKPDKGSFYDIVNSENESILEQKLNGKKATMHYLSEHNLTAANPEVLA